METCAYEVWLCGDIFELRVLITEVSFEATLEATLEATHESVVGLAVWMMAAEYGWDDLGDHVTHSSVEVASPAGWLQLA